MSACRVRERTYAGSIATTLVDIGRVKVEYKQPKVSMSNTCNEFHLSENSRPKSEAKNGGNSRQCQSISTVFVNAADTKLQGVCRCEPKFRV
jgi:hypothetical protein